ncbi:MAG: hypothetical protein K0R19_554 [Bacillota bacterium]|jgi:hypothetical protein|nr:hypothetical protein [Bacillota bacterium]
MQGTIINHKGEAVKAAEISVRKITTESEPRTSDAQDGAAGPLRQQPFDEEIRVQTDEEGTFTLENLDPNAKYVFEIRLKEFIHASQTDSIQNSYIAAPIRPVDTKVTGYDVRLGATEGKNSAFVNEARKDSLKNGWNNSEDGWNDGEEDDWNDQDDAWSDQDDDWKDSGEDGWSDRKVEIQPFAEEHTNTSASDNDDDYDDSEWFDIQEQEVMEQYAGNMIKPKKDLEDKLITIRKYIW